MQDAHSTADLRGIHNVGNGVAWASGTNGTVLRTLDNGATWTACSVPTDAEKLDFRGIQAFDANTAIVMSSGKGDLSRLYKTTDGCKSWKLVFTNPDKDGFWDAVVANPASAVVIGDPVEGRFKLFASSNNGFERWFPFEHPERAPKLSLPLPQSRSEAFFAASNSVLLGNASHGVTFVTGGADGSWLYQTIWHSWPMNANFPKFRIAQIPIAKSESAGAFSLSLNSGCHRHNCSWVIVGGDYRISEQSSQTSAFSGDGGQNWHSSETMPHGYRSSVAYDADLKAWITVGPNGTDISTDDGRNWRAVHPDAALHEAPDADRNWNALSLPFVVGPHGRIGKLDPEAIKAAMQNK
jgi:photosystem II stability/assembly factor-like uncharacterized protein